MSSTDSVISKIRKLLNIADKSRNTFEAEAESALEKVHELLLQNNLSLSDVAVESHDNSTTNKGEIREEVAITYKCAGIPYWLVLLMNCVSKVCDVYPITNHPVKKGEYGNYVISFVGEVCDSIVAKETFLYLKNRVTKMSTKHMKETTGKNTEWISFANGCCTNLYYRAENLVAERHTKVKDYAKTKFQKMDSSIDDEPDDELEDDLDDTIDEDLVDFRETQIEDVVRNYDIVLKSKTDKITEYLRTNGIKEDIVDTKASRNVDSYQVGFIEGDSIPLTKSKLLQQ